MKGRFFLALAVVFFLVAGSTDLLAQAPAATPDQNPEGDTGALKAQIQTGGSYDIQSGNATRIVNDLHVPGALGEYGLDFTRYWNSVHPEDTNFDAVWPQDFGNSGWSHSWKWSAVYGEEVPDFEPGNGLGTWITSITITFPDGHATKFKIARTNGGYGTIDPRCGPPYSNPGETDWPGLANHVHDRLDSMAYDGHEFWLSRADGGSVHFVGVYSELHNGHTWWSYEAKEIFDPHGFKTELIYQAGNLTEVRQEGGRSLVITWGQLPGLALGLIASVDSKGPNGEQLQRVSYWYANCGGPNSGHSVLSQVLYENESAPGPTPSATYTYSMNYGDGNNGFGQANSFPLLKTADDPHFAGAMTRISYKYWGNSCTTHPPPNCGVACMNWPTFRPETIVAERSMDRYSTVVSSFDPVCETGSRKESNGIGGWRFFYFGNQEGIYAWGYELTSESDFYQAGIYPQNPIRRKQNGSEPSSVWDGRGILTTLSYADGHPSQVHHIDGSNSFFDWVNPGNSAAPDLARIHNQRHHWLFKKTDELGNYTVYRRDQRRRVTNISYYNAAGVQVAGEAYSYNEYNQVTSHTLPSSNVVHYEYDGAHRLQREYNDVDIAISPSDYKFYTYYGPGDHPEWSDLVKIVVDGRARVSGAPFTTRMTYNGRQQVMSVENASTSGTYPTVRYEYDTYGNRTAVIDELGHRKDYIYDDYRRQTSCTEQVNGPGPNGTNVTSRRTDWIYDRVIDNFVGGPNTFRNTAHTSRDWRVQIEPAFNAAGDRRVTARTFDFNNRISSEQTGVIQPAGVIGPSNPWHNGPDTEIHRFTYDENGQKQTSTDPLGRVTTYGYDNRNRLETTTEPKRASQPENPVTRFEYDAAGNKKKVTFPDAMAQRWENYDPFGQAWQFYDERNNLTDLIYQWGPTKKLQAVTTYRQRDNPPGGTEAQPTSFEYDGMGRPKKTVFPDTSTEETTYLLGQVWKYKTRRGQTKVIDQYDARGRELHHYWLNYLNAPDSTTPAVTSVWDDAGRLTRILNVFSTIDYTYNDTGQVVTETSSVAGSGGQTPLDSAVSRQVIYWRHPSGEVAKITYPNGAAVTRDYTARGQLAGVGWGAGSTSYAYRPDGDVDYQAWTNNITTTYGYDGRGMISSVLHRNTQMGQDLAKREYWRNDRDQILAWKRGSVNTPNVMEDGRGDRFGYDEEGQLTSASYRVATPEGTPGTALRTDVFEYDKMGNRMGTHNLASKGSTNFARDNNGLNQYSSWTGSAINQDDDMGGEWGSPGHANGVTMQEGWITASFNALNQPMAMWCPTYGSNFMWFGYDPLGRCVKRWMGTVTGNAPNSNPATYYYYDGVDMIQEGSSALMATRIYVHGAGVDQIVASQVVTTGEWRFHHYDGQGNCILLTDTSGNIREQYDYDAFGLPYFYSVTGGKLATANQWGNRFLFTGREWLGDLRIYDYRARQYQPELGRFLQPDPKEFAAGDYNLYRYCHNDPVNKSDPTGLEDEKEKEPKKLVREVTRLVRTPTGSHIPQVIRYTESGNWLDTTISHHYKSGNGGSTIAEGTAKQSGLDWNIDLHVDWFVGKDDEDSDVVTRELDHVQDFRDFSAAYARSLSGVSPAMFSQQVADKLEESRNKYDGSKAQQMSQGAALDKKHNLSRYPKQPATLPEFEDTASKVPYNPTSDPRY